MPEMLTMRQLMDQLMENAVVPYDRSNAAGSATDTQMDVIETPDAYEVTLVVPGARPEDLNITFENNILTVRGEICDERETTDQTVHLRERRFGSFVRTIMLPGNLRSEAIEARYDNGLLTVRIPKSEGARPQRIEVRNGSSGQQADAASGNGQQAKSSAQASGQAGRDQPAAAGEGQSAGRSSGTA
jgi:HSP20 family protein